MALCYSLRSSLSTGEVLRSLRLTQGTGTSAKVVEYFGLPRLMLSTLGAYLSSVVGSLTGVNAALLAPGCRLLLTT